MACPAIVVDIVTEPLSIAHGRTANAFASISPDGMVPYDRIWAVTGVSGAGCALGDLVLGTQTDAAGSSYVPVTVPGDPAKVACQWTLTLTVNAYGVDTTTVTIRSTPPVLRVDRATFDGSAWNMVLPAGVGAQPIQISATDAEADTPLVFTLAGPDVGQLACAPSCMVSDATSPYQLATTWVSASPGTYQLTATASDGFEPAASANINVVVETCVWVRAGASGVGSLADPMGSVQAALVQASSVLDAHVCILGAGTFSENITVPVTPNAPDLLGGFAASGLVDDTQRPIIQSNNTTGATFAAGYAGTVRNVAFRQSTAAFAGQVDVVTIRNASPQILRSTVVISSGMPAVGVLIEDAGGSSTRPQLIDMQLSVSAPSALATITGVMVRRAPGGATPIPVLRGGSFLVSNCTGTCTAIRLAPGTSSTVTGASISGATQGGTALGIDVEGSATQGTSAVISNNSSIQASAGTGGDSAVAVRLNLANRVSITGNNNVTAALVGPGFNAAIADGAIAQDGTLTPGNSSLVTISNNAQISGGYWSGSSCEGPEVNAGVVLVGTSNVTITGNGRPNSTFGGVRGGQGTVHWTAATRRVLPSNPALWLLDTSGVTLSDNELKAGTMSAVSGCIPPMENPPVVAFRDGIPPNAEMGALGSNGSVGTLANRNGMSCAVPPQSGAPGAGTITWCTVVELNNPLGADAPILFNNHLAATKGNVLVALRQRGGSGVVAMHNTFDADLMLEPFEPTPGPGSIRKWSVLLNDVADDGISLVNNIFYAHRDEPYDDATERLLYVDVNSGGGSSAVVLAGNLFCLEGDNVMIPGPAYVRITTGAVTTQYTSDQIGSLPGIPTQSGNFASATGLTEPDADWQKSQARLTATSPAVDQGVSLPGLPGQDMDRQARPNPTTDTPDVGHDEWY